MKEFKSGFTLAEVLITLGIIGVVASITMPALIANYEKKATLTQLKKTYSMLSQIAKLAEVDYGSMDEWDTSLSAKNFAETYFVPYLRTVKTCTAITDGCWRDNGYYDLKNSKITVTPFSVVLTDGTVVGFAKPITNTPVIVVDVNGAKGRNRLGRDVFAFLVLSRKNGYLEWDSPTWAWMTLPTGIYPGSYANGGVPHAIFDAATVLKTTYDTEGRGAGLCNKAAAGNGEVGVGGACTVAIVNNNWEIPDGYPWN
ncbi:MAG: type II secretion system GspH family protein [Heliobacteriaceae bacterium]|jgi:prepilin-type N-terminal cleavage/methylation domain-containing protein|nr:type II secretion system GspH family protein [Heliobacteriaceae bacterium]